MSACDTRMSEAICLVVGGLLQCEGEVKRGTIPLPVDLPPVGLVRFCVV